MRRLAIAAMGLLLAACTREFVTDPIRAVTITPGLLWRDTFAVTDRDTLRLAITDSARGETIVGLEVQWTSSDPSVLELEAVSGGPDSAAAFAARLSIVATAHLRGQVEVTAEVNRAGFATVRYTDTVVVTERWVSVAVGTDHSCAITAAGEVYCWGCALCIGNGGVASTIPERVLGLADNRIGQVEIGDGHTCALSVDGLLFCWGANNFGQLGTGDVTSRLKAVDAAAGQAFRSISAGAGVTCGIERAGGSVYCWGHNGAGELGIGGNTSGLVPCDINDCLTGPVNRVLAPYGAFLARSVSTGGAHTCGISDGPNEPSMVRCWGRADVGQLGSVQTAVCQHQLGPTPCATEPESVATTLQFARVSVSLVRFDYGSHTCGMSTALAAWCWGLNDRGQLGTGAASGPEICDAAAVLMQQQVPCSRSPVAVSGANTTIMLSSGGSHTCAVDPGGTARCWGRNDAGQLGTGSETGPETCTATPLDLGLERSRACSTSPVPVAGGLLFATVAAGATHTCGLTRQEGAIYCWGRNVSGLGANSVFASTVPVRIAEPVQ